MSLRCDTGMPVFHYLYRAHPVSHLLTWFCYSIRAGWLSSSTNFCYVELKDLEDKPFRCSIENMEPKI